MTALKMCQSPATFILTARNSLSYSLRIEMSVIRPGKMRGVGRVAHMPEVNDLQKISVTKYLGAVDLGET